MQARGENVNATQKGSSEPEGLKPEPSCITVPAQEQYIF